MCDSLELLSANVSRDQLKRCYTQNNFEWVCSFTQTSVFALAPMKRTIKSPFHTLATWSSLKVIKERYSLWSVIIRSNFLKANFLDGQNYWNDSFLLKHRLFFGLWIKYENIEMRKNGGSCDKNAHMKCEVRMIYDSCSWAYFTSNNHVIPFGHYIRK